MTMPISRPTFDWKNLVFSGLGLAASFCPCIASATLGEPEASVQADVAQIKGSIKVMSRSSYRLHEIQLPSGTVVREFADLNGNVFAVAWTGPRVPNLRQTLGRYFDAYATAAKDKHAGRRPLSMQRNDLVIQTGGHMRAFSGRAYLPTALPPGVSVGDLR
jgi:hypothetical protein